MWLTILKVHSNQPTVSFLGFSEVNLRGRQRLKTE